MLDNWQNVEYEIGLVYRPYVWAFEGDNDAHVLQWQDSRINGLKVRESAYAQMLSGMNYNGRGSFQFAQLQNAYIPRHLSDPSPNTRVPHTLQGLLNGMVQAGASMLYRR